MGLKRTSSHESYSCVAKVKTVIDYWKELPKSKQPGSGKPGANVSYDRLCATLNDPLIL